MNPHELRDMRVDELAALVAREAAALMRAIPPAMDRQWERSPVPPTRAERKGTGRVSDPTADVALDLRRLAVRQAIRRAEDVMRATALTLNRTRHALERAVARFDGE